MVKNYYPTFEEASDAFAKILEKKKLDQYTGTAFYVYQGHYDEDPRLPPSPEFTYRSVWKEKGGWKTFLKRKDEEAVFYTFEEAQEAIQKLRPVPRNSTEYAKFQRQNRRLTSTPATFYPDFEDRGGWDAYLLLAEIYINKNPQYYEDIFEAKKAIIKLGIKNENVYRTDYKFDPKLPPNLREYYGKYALQKAFGSCYKFI